MISLLGLASTASSPRRAKPVVTETSVVVGCVDGKVRTYDLRKGRMHADNFKVPVTSVTVSRDGHVAAASCLDRSCRLIEGGGRHATQSVQRA